MCPPGAHGQAPARIRAALFEENKAAYLVWSRPEGADLVDIRGGGFAAGDGPGYRWNIEPDAEMPRLRG